MQSVVLGLKDSLRQSLAPWLCHDCGECATTCPREANPRESMATLRHFLTAEYDWSGLSGRAFQSALWEFGALSGVGLLVLALFVCYHLYIARLDVAFLTSTATGMEHMFPLMTYVTLAVFILPALAIASHAAHMFTLTMRRGAAGPVPFRFFVEAVLSPFLKIATQKQILQCRTPARTRFWFLHAFLASGCVLMFLIKFFFLRWFQTDQIYGLLHPQRWLGYIGAAFLLIGCTDILVKRIRRREPGYKRSHFSDLILPVLLVLTALSGIAVHILRYTGFALGAHYAYAVHLMIVVPMVVVEVPLGKTSHVIYRPLALYLAAVRERALRHQLAEEAKAA
jgi:ferredoxin